jgi:hypothetical protein
MKKQEPKENDGNLAEFCQLFSNGDKNLTNYDEPLSAKSEPKACFMPSNGSAIWLDDY